MAHVMYSVITKRLEDLRQFCERFGVRRLEVFGSAATCEAFDSERSDLDFLVEYHPDHNLGPWLKRHTEFQDELQRLFGRSVDLVMTTALKSERLIREINRSRCTVYASEVPQKA